MKHDRHDNHQNDLYYLLYQLIKSHDQIKFIDDFNNLNYEILLRYNSELINKPTKNTNARILYYASYLHIKNIKKLISLLKKLNFNLAHKVMLFEFMKADLYIRISSFSVLLHAFYDDIDKLKKQIKDCLRYLKSFTDISHKIDDYDGTIPTNNKIMFENSYHRNECILRLQQLVKYFGIDLMKECEIDIITYDDAESMKKHELFSYYNTTVKKLKKKITKYFQFCDAYTELVSGYYLMSGTYSDEISLQHFHVIVS